MLNIGGVAVKPDATWSVVGTGDFDGDTRADILWRKSNGTLVEWNMNGSTVASSGLVTSSGVAVKLDATWSVAGIGDFNDDDNRDVLWRNADGTLTEWNMNGSTVTSSGLVAAGAAKPDASWSVAGIGDFDADGNSDILWRNSNGTLAEWFLNGTNLIGSNTITSGDVAVAPDATWHVVEIGDFNGDGKSDILWRNDNGAVAEWLLNGSAIMQSVTAPRWHSGVARRHLVDASKADQLRLGTLGCMDGLRAIHALRPTGSCQDNPHGHVRRNPTKNRENQKSHKALDGTGGRRWRGRRGAPM